jgi:PAS domain S-box-containing protein
MIPPIVFLLSITLQLTAAVYAFRLAGAPKQKAAWTLIALALLLMAGRRVMTFVSLVLAGAEIPFDAPEIVALGVSGLMLMGVIRMGRYFQSVVSTEEAMRKKDEVLSTGQRIAHMGSWEWNVEKDEIVWSEEIYRIFGLSRNEFDGTYEGFLARVHAEDREFVRNEVGAALHEGKPFSIDYRIVQPDKAQRRIFAQGEVTRGANGKPVRMAGTVLDITERRQAEEALKALARQQRAAAELGRAALRGMDLPSLMNEAVSLSARTLDVEYTKVLEFLPADDSFRLVAGVGWKPGLVGHARIPAGKDSQAGYTLLSDEPVTVEDLRMESRFSGPPLLHDHGVISGMSIIIGGEDGPFGVFGVHTRRHRVFTEDDVHFLETVANILADAIRQQRTQYLLREGEENFRMLVENANDGILLAGSQGTHLFANRRAAEITGYSTDELLKVTIKDLAHPDELPKIMERFVMRMARQDAPRQYETVIRRKDGESLPIEITASRTTWKGQPAVIVVFRDIAERRQLEEEHLRTAKLESLGTLAGGIAHDFNNILTGVLANVSLAGLHVPPDGKARHLLAQAEKATLRARDLTHQLLTFAKGGVPVKKVFRVADRLEDWVTFALRGSSTKAEIDPGSNLWAVEADEGQISQVIQNVVINADQAMPNGGTVRVRASNAQIGAGANLPLDPGKYVRLCVIDEGIGIPPEHLPRIFDPYFTTKQRGSGLGLATAFSIVRNHEGAVSVESELGVGTTIEIYLPAWDGPLPETPCSEETLRKGSGRILVMDDEEAVREAAGEVLRHVGYDASFARDGAEAVDLYRRARESGTPFDAVIVDLTVPGGIGGKEAVRQIAAFDPGVKAVVSSGYANDPVMADYRHHGFSAVITKPYSTREMGKVLGNLLGNGG